MRSHIATLQTESAIAGANFVVALDLSGFDSVGGCSGVEGGCAADFHPRKSAQAKSYRYRIVEAICPPFLTRSVSSLSTR